MNSNGLNAVYVGGQVDTDAYSQANQGEYVAGTGLLTVNLPVGITVDTYSFFNNGQTPVRVTIIPVPSLAANFLGNKSALVLSGHSFQESFSKSVIAGVTVEAVTLPLVSTSVDALPADVTSQVSAILKFVEN